MCRHSRTRTIDLEDEAQKIMIKVLTATQGDASWLKSYPATEIQVRNDLRSIVTQARNDALEEAAVECEGAIRRCLECLELSDDCHSIDAKLIRALKEAGE